MPDQINGTDNNKDAVSVTPISGKTGAEPESENSFLKQVGDFYLQYKAQIGLAVLIIYVITLAIATIIEILEH